MALKIRLQRHGSTHNPVYRIVVAESSNRRDGRHNEVLGSYNPRARGKDTELSINLERVDYWVSVGAKPTDTTRTLINRARRAETAAPVEATAEA
ncbi:30S ribosomal protein S16 [Cerasicoccus arenae]|uniref:Small ribosomal subunit protein bS16 n=1 Tax=Cerasicoccus arenae TaxID=424488 RepID=A0A8J3DFM2_9BACT|nr:30S ribosomal protein S16 [Cerasicoccus arenae]MBK1858181.1 30S ribosomal protein S16 [Cerasicoccus arenae]GHC00995.1 30S ribosomal protein S16 [Cerasicoccus arenae]